MSQTYIPKEVFFDVKKDDQAFSKKFGFLTYQNDLGKLRKESQLLKWAGKVSKIKNFENVPSGGFVLNRHIEHFTHNFNKDNIRFRVFCPEGGGFEFEISALNLSYILSFCDISKGQIMSDCVFGWREDELLLLPVGSQLYLEAQKNTERQDNFDSLKLQDSEGLEFGTLLQNKTGKFFVYLGKRKFVPYDDVEKKMVSLNPDNFQLIDNHLHFVYPNVEHHLVLPVNTSSRGAHTVVNNIGFYKIANMKNLMQANCTAKELGINYSLKELKEEWTSSYYRNGNANIFTFVNKSLSTDDLLVFDFFNNLHDNPNRNFIRIVRPKNKKMKVNVLISSFCLLSIDAKPITVGSNEFDTIFEFELMKNLKPWKSFKGTWLQMLDEFNLLEINNSYSIKNYDKFLDYKVTYYSN